MGCNKGSAQGSALNRRSAGRPGTREGHDALASFSPQACIARSTPPNPFYSFLPNHHHLSHKSCKTWPRSLTRYTTDSRPRSEVRFSASGSYNVALTAIARAAYCSEWYSVERRQQRGTNDCNSFRRYQMGAMDSRCQKLPATHKPRSQRQEASFG